MKLTSSQIKKYNKIADAGKNPIMVRVGHNWYTWYEGDPKHGVFLTTQSGADVEFDFKQIDDIQESKMVKMKSKLREIIREEIQKLNEVKRYPDNKVWKGGDIGQMEQNIDKVKTYLWELFENVKSEQAHYKSAQNAIKLVKKALLKVEVLVDRGK
jgi:hypothetical protein